MSWRNCSSCSFMRSETSYSASACARVISSVSSRMSAEPLPCFGAPSSPLCRAGISRPSPSVAHAPPAALPPPSSRQPRGSTAPGTLDMELRVVVDEPPILDPRRTSISIAAWAVPAANCDKHLVPLTFCAAITLCVTFLAFPTSACRLALSVSAFVCASASARARISLYSSSKLAPMIVMGSESTSSETVIVMTATTRPHDETG
mmetsp:Transcript_26593/g.70983  ORF Transcript_26593/g.70983 Transcript_26593/m.70983 type:complete len:205 (+) Transcript_26593:373-987(+)